MTKGAVDAGGRRLVAGVLLGLLGSVTGCADTGPDVGPVVRDSAGITIVENDATRPRWTSPWTLSEEPELRIGSVEGDPEQLLFQVTDSHVLPDRRILLANSGSAEVRVYDPEGRLLQTLGRRGEGPGEFTAPWQAYPMPGDSILVIDLYREVAVFDPEGEFARQFDLDLPEGLLGAEGAEPVDQFGDGSLLFRGHYPYQPGPGGVTRNVVPMLRVPLDGAPAVSLGDFEDQTGYSGQPHRDYAHGAWAKEAAADSTMWYGPGDRMELREVARDGRLIRIVRLNRAARPITEADRETFRRDYAKQMAEFNPRQGEPFWRERARDVLFPDSFPVHYEIETDPLGNVWVQDYRSFFSEARMDREWTVFDAEGAYLGEVTVPGGMEVHDVTEDFVVGKWTDDLGVEYVHVHRIEKPGG
ncbi:MAG TPA: hypothetical protein VK858_19840 [Longimicrobiales bacterium]|nr:hypothetical protein [Longimicrobiales bacterium]